MATAVNDITGALITTKGKSTTNYADNYDRIFRNKPPAEKPGTVVITIQLKNGEHLAKLPEDIIRELGWGIGEKLEVTIDDDKLVLAKL